MQHVEISKALTGKVMVMKAIYTTQTPKKYHSFAK